MNINAFQYILKLKDEVTKPVEDIRNSMVDLTKVTETLQKAWYQIRNLVISVVGFATVREAFIKLNEVASEYDKTLTSLSNRSGSDKLGKDMTAWVNTVSMQYGVARDDITSLTNEYLKLGADVRKLDMKSLIATSLGTGRSVTDLEAQFRGLSRQLTYSYEDIYALDSEFGRGAGAKIFASMAGKTKGSVEAVSGALKYLGERYKDTTDRQAQSIEGMKQISESYKMMFTEHMMGDKDSGPLSAIRRGLQMNIDFMKKNKPYMDGLAIGFGKIIEGLVDGFNALKRIIFDNLDKMFHKMGQTSDGFVKNTVYPFVTYIEILKIKLGQLIKGFIEGFIDSPVWGGLKLTFGIIWKVVSGIVGLLPGMNSLGKAIGFVASVAVGLFIFKKIGDYAKYLRVEFFKSINGIVNVGRAFGQMGKDIGDVWKQSKGMMQFRNYYKDGFRMIEVQSSSTWTKIKSGIGGTAQAIGLGMKSMKAAFLDNPVGILLVVLPLAIEGFNKLFNSMEKVSEASKIIKEASEGLTEKYIDQRKSLNGLIEEYRKTKKGSDEQKTAFQNIIDMVPNIEKGYTKLNKAMDDETGFIRASIEALKDKIIQESLEDVLKKNMAIVSNELTNNMQVARDITERGKAQGLNKEQIKVAVERGTRPSEESITASENISAIQKAISTKTGDIWNSLSDIISNTNDMLDTQTAENKNKIETPVVSKELSLQWSSGLEKSSMSKNIDKSVDYQKDTKELMQKQLNTQINAGLDPTTPVKAETKTIGGSSINKSKTTIVNQNNNSLHLDGEIINKTSKTKVADKADTKNVMVWY